MKIVIDKSNPWHSIDVAKAEEMYNAEYLGYFAIKDKHGNWTESPVEIFYVKDPDYALGHTNYFALYYRNALDTNNGVYISKGDSAFSDIINCIVCNDVVTFSRYRHDFRETNVGFIDGGRDYIRVGGNPIPKLYNMTVSDGEFYIDGEKLEKVYV